VARRSASSVAFTFFAVCALFIVPIASSAAPALDFTQLGSLTNNWSPTKDGFSMGWEFNVLQPVLVDRLGYFNYGPTGQGITTPHEVGIFDSNGTLLVSTTVNPGDPVSGIWAWKTLSSPFELAPGQGYVLAGLTGPTDLYTYRVNSITVDPSISYVKNRYVRTGTGALIFPIYTVSETGYSYFGPNMDLRNVPPVPEPALIQLPLLLGMAGLGYWRRRRSCGD